MLNSRSAVPGLGYWLTFNNKIMKDVEVGKLALRLRDVYKKMNSSKKLKEYNVKKIVVYKDSAFANMSDGRVFDEYKIIDIN